MINQARSKRSEPDSADVPNDQKNILRSLLFFDTRLDLNCGFYPLSDPCCCLLQFHRLQHRDPASLGWTEEFSAISTRPGLLASAEEFIYLFISNTHLDFPMHHPGN